jgi:hypothetical protein
MRTTILLALLIVGSAAHASEWVSLGKSDDGKNETFVDVSDIRVSEVRRAWIKAVAADSSKTVYREAFNCEDGTSRSEAIDTYSIDGSTTSTPDYMLRQASWRPIRPDTTWHVVMKFICAWKPK